VELEPLEGLYKALWKAEGGVEGILSTYFTKSPAPTLSVEDFAYHPNLSLLVRYVGQAVKRRELGTNVLLYGPPGTGKTELARTLAEHVRARLFEVSTEDGDGEALGGGQRLRGYLLSQRVLSQTPDSLLLFDEIEDAFPLARFLPVHAHAS
jgi:transitional endoplasmic reticulum ATPase